MIISDIRQTRRGRVSIYADGEFVCVLHPDLFATSTLCVNSAVDTRYLGELTWRSQERFARERALSLLSQRPYTRQRLYRKVLEKVEDEEIAEAAVARMEELGLIDDTDYARRYARDCLNLKGYSLRRTLQALREKGIDRETAEAVLEELDYDPHAAIAAVLLKKYAGHLEDEQGVKKAVAALQRRGFRYSDIAEVLRNLSGDMDYYR